MIFESHAHYDDSAFDGDREELLRKVRESGVEYIVNVSSSLETVKSTVELTHKYPYIFGTAGIHPSDTEELSEEGMLWLKEQCGLDKIVAVGEIGLDYYWDEPDREIQKKWFIRQLVLAGEVGLPVVIHSRDAAQDTLEIMRECSAETLGGVIHCFSYGVEMARRYLGMGFYIGVGGVVTFKNGRKLKEVVEVVPLERILLETDSPYLAPVPNRGKRNTSLNLMLIAAEIGKIKNVPVQEVIEATNRNAKTCFGKGKYGIAGES